MFVGALVSDKYGGNKRTTHSREYYYFINPVTFFPTLPNVVPTLKIKYNVICNIDMTTYES